MISKSVIANPFKDSARFGAVLWPLAIITGRCPVLLITPRLGLFAKKQ